MALSQWSQTRPAYNSAAFVDVNYLEQVSSKFLVTVLGSTSRERTRALTLELVCSLNVLFLLSAGLQSRPVALVEGSGSLGGCTVVAIG